MLDQTKVKRTAIILIYVALFVIIGLAVYFIKKPAATCSDGKQNQAEKGIDCGGPCSPCKEDIAKTKDLEIQETAFANGGNGTYDVVAKIYNPNGSQGAKEFEYEFAIKDVSGSVISTRIGKSFVLPGDSRYIAQLGLSAEGNAVPSDVDIKINNVQWEKISAVGKPQIGVYGKKLNKTSMSDGSEVEGIIRNESGYDLRDVSIVVVLRDEMGKIVGINSTVKNSVRIKEDREFLFIWPYALGADVQKIEVDPQSDIFDPQNFSVVN